MASLYPRKNSPFWWLQFRDSKTGKLVNRSTGLRRDDAEHTREAKRLRAQWEQQELSAPRAAGGEAWAEWVPTYLKTRYAKSPLTATRAESCWRALSTYFKAKGLRSARVLTRADAMAYIGWRLSDEAWTSGLRRVKYNTALLELKFPSGIMREAVSRGIALVNPCIQLGLKREKTKVKPEISDEEFEKIERALSSADEIARPYNEAMRISWAIAIRQVCRLRETCVPLDDVNLEEGTITFRIKGGREHTAALHPELVPLFTRLKAEGRRMAYPMPDNFAKCWYYFFRRHGLSHLTFHSTRVTGVTRLRRQGVDVRVAMEFVGHSSLIVHQIYQRRRKNEQSAAITALSRSPATPAGN